MCHRQALHFLSRAEYSAALELVERARMTYLDNRQEEENGLNILENGTDCMISDFLLLQGDGGPGHQLHQHCQHPGSVPAQARGLCHVQEVC